MCIDIHIDMRPGTCTDMCKDAPVRQAIVICTIMYEMMELSLVLDPPHRKGEWKQHKTSQMMVLPFHTQNSPHPLVANWCRYRTTARPCGWQIIAFFASCCMLAIILPVSFFYFNYPCSRDRRCQTAQRYKHNILNSRHLTCCQPQILYICCLSSGIIRACLCMLMHTRMHLAMYGCME